MTLTIGQQWRRDIAAESQEKEDAEKEAQRKQQEEDGPFMILQIPQLIIEARGAKRDYIIILPSPLCSLDVACRDVNEFQGTCWGRDIPVKGENLDGRARIIFDYCIANDLVVYVIGLNMYDITLIAKAR